MSVTILEENLPLSYRKELAGKLRKAGLSYPQIAQKLQANRTTILYWLNPLSYKKKLETSRKYRQDNPEKVSEWNKRYLLKNPEKACQSHRLWYKKNRKKRIAYNKMYRKGNREKGNEYQRKYRREYNHERTRNFLYGTHFVGHGKRKKMGGFLLGQGLCVICGELNPLCLENHHIFKESNSRLSLCGSCHTLIHRMPIMILERLAD